MYIGLHVKYPLLLSDFIAASIFRTDFFKKNTRISNFMNIHPVPAELLHALGGTDMAKVMVALRKFCERA